MNSHFSPGVSAGYESAFARFLSKKSFRSVPSKIEKEILTEFHGGSEGKKWLSVQQLSLKHPVFTENSLRALIFASKPRLRARGKGGDDVIPGNGLAHAIRKVGRRVLIDELAFMEWVDSRPTVK
ncbi:hypothetical protein ACFIQF_19420 [Comamonas sp. J-3]|uniref:hypothetical protein n=1 Tax=Comamonas trifloxystrobinivorans TaxID=3350256 RepID=UPI0037261E9C